MKKDGLNKWQRYRLKNLEEYRKRKAEYARSPEQREKRTEYMKKWREMNREKFNEICRQSHIRSRRKRSPEQRHDAHLRQTYGITRKQFLEMLEKQEGKCAICFSPSARWKKQFHVDHCHKTEVVRGLLCNRCNPMLGWYETYQKQIAKYLSNAI